jgi:hypothetical protein
MWWALVRNALWLAGLAVGLAALSMASYQARLEEVRLWKKLHEPGIQLPITIGAMLFCLGLCFGGRSWWEQAIWGLLATVFTALAIQIWRR